MEIERLLRIRMAILHYFDLHNETPSPENYRAWFNSLNASQREQIRDLGYETGRKLISFQAGLPEQKGFYIKEFLQMHLSPEDFEYLLRISRPVLEGQPY